MSRIIGCILLAAAMLLTAACAPDVASESPARTATPMQTLTPDEAFEILEEEAEGESEATVDAEARATADTTIPATDFDEMDELEDEPTAEPTETEDLWGDDKEDFWGEETAEPTATATATPRARQTASRTESPMQSVVPSSTSTLGPLAQYVLLPGDMQYAVSHDWPSPAKAASSDLGMRTYQVQPSDTLVIMYQNVGSALSGSQSTNKDILLKMVEAQSLWFGSRELTDVSDMASVPYAWISWFGHSNDLIDPDPDVTHVAAFSDGEYLYIAAQISSVDLESSINEWTAFLDSMTLNGEQVWFTS